MAYSSTFFLVRAHCVFRGRKLLERFLAFAHSNTICAYPSNPVQSCMFVESNSYISYCKLRYVYSLILIDIPFMWDGKHASCGMYSGSCMKRIRDILHHSIFPRKFFYFYLFMCKEEITRIVS